MDMELIKIILQFLGVIGVGGIMAGVVSRKITKTEKRKADKEQEILDKENKREQTVDVLCVATKVLLRSEIYSMCNKIKKRGKMFLYEQEQLRELLAVYTSLGGNGTAHAIVDKVLLEYDVVSDDEEMD